ncbi:MAG: lipopolysaccharide heptosyltransferase II [Bryobacterales bacterium]|nr:lipopolysaccharide heptosyltransferase II [Bryobacterales bacterium]
MSLPALRLLRARYPSAWIALQAMPWVADLYAGEKVADQILLYTARRGTRDWSGKWRAARRLRSNRLDTALLLTNSFDSALVVRLAGIRRRIGYSRDGRGWLLTDAIPPPRRGEIPRHERFYYLELLRRAGIIESLPPPEPVRLESAPAARPAGEEHFRQMGWAVPVIGVSPGAAYGGAKRWPPESFARAAEIVASALGGKVAVFGSMGERPTAQLLADSLAVRGVGVRNLAGETSLSRFIELAAACRVFLTNDSGAMHVASVLGVPTVAVFGATDPEATGPLGPASRVIMEPADCAPCLLRECPTDHRCMTRVTPERVAAEALDLLKW